MSPLAAHIAHDVVASLAKTQPTPLSIGLMRRLGNSVPHLSPHVQAQLPIRHAKSVNILHQLQPLLPNPSAAHAVAATMDRLVEDITMLNQMDAAAKPAVLASTLHVMRGRHGVALNDMQEGLKVLVGSTVDRKKLKEIRKLLDEFYTVNIGSHLLLDEHLSLLERQQNIVKVIDPAAIAQTAIDDARAVCSRHYGFDAPLVELQNQGTNVSTVYIENHLHRILYECIKNSLRAVAESHHLSTTMPPVQLMLVNGGEDIVFKLSDRGHGLAQSRIARLFNYGICPAPHRSAVSMLNTANSKCSTSNDESPSISTESHNVDSRLSSQSRQSSNVDYVIQSKEKSYLSQPMTGNHHGLSLARLHARFFGGDLQLESMEGHGTDLYIYLHKEEDH